MIFSSRARNSLDWFVIRSLSEWKKTVSLNCFISAARFVLPTAAVLNDMTTATHADNAYSLGEDSLPFAHRAVKPEETLA